MIITKWVLSFKTCPAWLLLSAPLPDGHLCTQMRKDYLDVHDKLIEYLTVGLRSLLNSKTTSGQKTQNCTCSSDGY